MWLLLVLVINFQNAPSQLVAEFNNRDACITAATEYKARIEMMPNSNPKVVVLCAKKG